MADSDPIQIVLDDLSTRQHKTIHHKDNSLSHAPIYTNKDERISGKVLVNFSNSQIKSPVFVKIEMIGKMELYGKTKKNCRFLHREYPLGCLARNGKQVKEMSEMNLMSKSGRQGQDICEVKELPSLSFSFEECPADYESYMGGMIGIRYFIVATMIGRDCEQYKAVTEFAVQIGTAPRNTNLFNIQIGVMDAVEVDLEYKKIDFELNECIIGKVMIHLALVDIKKIELYLIRLESWFIIGGHSKIKEEVIDKITLKEGQPRKGELIPIKMYLGSLNLSPSMVNVENRFSVKYFLTLGLIDHNERMFFRKVEIHLYRGLD